MSRQGHGFTLVESVLALGVVAMVLLVLMALLPGGLAQSQSGDERAMTARMLPWVREACRSVDLPHEWSFDADGTPQQAGAGSASFHVQADEEPAAFLPGDAEARLRRIRIAITRHAGQGVPRIYHVWMAPSPPFKE